MKPIAFVLALGCAPLAAHPLHAQMGNASDVTGPITTSGDIAGGAFRPEAVATSAASPAASAALEAAGRSLSASLAAGTLSATSPSGSIVRIAPDVQADLLATLNGGGPAAALLADLEASGSTEAGQLALALRGLLASPSNDQLAAAVGLFNATVKGAGDGFLDNPPAGFVGVHAVLAALAAATR